MSFSQRLALGAIRAKFKLLSSISKKKAAEKAFALFCTPQKRNLKSPPKVFEEAESLKCQVEDLTVTGWRWNHPCKRKLLILHGFESSAVNFDGYIRPFINKGYEVLAFDAPAHGRSGGKMISAPLYKKMILDINRQFGPVQSFLAHSFGGLALALALEEIPHDDQYRIALIAPATETSTAIDSFFHLLRIDPRVRPEFDRLILRKSGVGPGWYSIRRAMQQIQASTLWIHDENDETTPVADAMQVKAENHPGIRFVFTRGLGHRRIYRDNSVRKLVVEFL